MEKKLAIYLIRGLSRESGHWGNFIEVLKDKFPNSEIHLLDLDGTGKHYLSKSPSSIPKLVDSLKKKYKLNDKNINLLVASSLGGMVAIEWVMRFANDFDGLVTMNSSFRGICKSFERVKPKTIFHLFKIIRSSKLRSREKLILELNSNYPENNKILDEWVKIQQLRPVKKINILRQTFAGFRFFPKKEKISIPYLHLGSKQDKLVCSSCIEKVHFAFGGELIWHEFAGHCLPLDEPDWTANQIKNWFKKLNTNEDIYNWCNK